jgi:hypoxanthine phosphoribosyltransferase
MRRIGVALVESTKDDTAFSERLARPILRGIVCGFEIPDSRILVIDDIVRSGDTAQVVVDWLSTMGCERVVVVAPFAEARPYNFQCYSNNQVGESSWIKFPWA